MQKINVCHMCGFDIKQHTNWEDGLVYACDEAFANFLLIGFFKRLQALNERRAEP